MIAVKYLLGEVDFNSYNWGFRIFARIVIFMVADAWRIGKSARESRFYELSWSVPFWIGIIIGGYIESTSELGVTGWFALLAFIVVILALRVFSDRRRRARLMLAPIRNTRTEKMFAMMYVGLFPFAFGAMLIDGHFFHEHFGWFSIASLLIYAPILAFYGFRFKHEKMFLTSICQQKG